MCLEFVVSMVQSLSPHILNIVYNHYIYSFTKELVEKTKLNKMPKCDSDENKIKTNK